MSKTERPVFGQINENKPKSRLHRTSEYQEGFVHELEERKASQIMAVAGWNSLYRHVVHGEPWGYPITSPGEKGDKLGVVHWLLLEQPDESDFVISRFNSQRDIPYRRFSSKFGIAFVQASNLEDIYRLIGAQHKDTAIPEPGLISAQNGTDSPVFPHIPRYNTSAVIAAGVLNMEHIDKFPGINEDWHYPTEHCSFVFSELYGYSADPVTNHKGIKENSELTPTMRMQLFRSSELEQLRQFLSDTRYRAHIPSR